jgi:radical SAM superfamily enzyme YgiQ (UPF0313 family)
MHREDLLQQFSGLEGVYVPMFYAVGYDAQGNISSFRPRIGASPRIKKRIVKDLDSSPYPLDWLLPYIQIIHDRISLELMRGCPHRCRFCQAKSQYFPLRYRNPQRLLALAQGAYASCGYEEISLAGLSVTDYPHLKELLQGLIADFKSKAVGISLPSIKPKPGLGELSALLAKIKKTGLTFAPEAGTEALRAVLGKDFSLEDFFKSLEESYRCGYQRVKLYFMLGLPFEKDTDLDAIIDFSQRVSQIRRKACGHSAEVNISVNAFVPKPHTPLQWLGMDTLEAIRGKQNYLKDKARDRKLKLSFHNCEMSFLEGVLSRGDRRLSRVVLAAYQGGARFDAWSNSFRFDVWMDAFKNSRLDPVFYLRRIPEDALLAWDFIDMGTEKGSLREEFNKVIAAE